MKSTVILAAAAAVLSLSAGAFAGELYHGQKDIMSGISHEKTVDVKESKDAKMPMAYKDFTWYNVGV